MLATTMLDDIEKILKNGENSFTEFKEVAVAPETLSGRTGCLSQQ